MDKMVGDQQREGQDGLTEFIGLKTSTDWAYWAAHTVQPVESIPTCL